MNGDEKKEEVGAFDEPAIEDPAPQANGNGEDVVAAISLEDYELPEDLPETVENTVQGAIRYGFIGSGQGGGRLAQEAYDLGYKKTIVVNTSPQDLSSVKLPEEQKLHLDIGPGGAGANMAKGEEALTQHQQAVYNKMKNVFDTHVDHIIICASAGGGSGGGSLKPLIMVAKRYLQFLGYVEDIDQRVGVVLTLPTTEEQASTHVAANALEAAVGISDLAERDSVTPVIVIDNSRIRDLYRKIPYNVFWPTVNKGVLELFDIFNRLSMKTDGFVSFDPADYAAVMRTGGHAVMGVVSVRPDDVGDESKVFKVLDRSLNKTLLADGFDYSTAQASGVVIVGGEQTFAEVPSMDRVIEYVGNMVANMTGGAKVYRGVYQDKRPGLRVYTFISGMKRPEQRYKKLEALSRERYP